MNNRKKIREQFINRGESLTDWAKQRGFNLRTVNAVIDGDLKATRGVSHAIAVELGLKKTRPPKSEAEPEKQAA